mgnify:CR=1 FL=1|tara:strand:- start:2084 stop:2638 length:555 start_codon:yes stop_codon:yes gene_type:complete
MILGIDPGFASCGYALLELDKEDVPRFSFAGVVRTQKTHLKIPLYTDNVQRTQIIYEHLKTFAHTAIFFAVEAESWTRMPSDKLLGLARGAIYGLAYELGAGLEQYGPKEIKREFVDSASASKGALEEKILELHPELVALLEPLPKTQRAHASDAAACALMAFRKSNYVRAYLRRRHTNQIRKD